jgi:geranylgeranyl pyrophosphate synthase
MAAMTAQLDLSSHLAHIESFLDTVLSQTDPVVPRFWEALRYGVLNGGKRLRPLLCLEVGLACGATLEAVLPTACALELVHAQSLMHDDLPCMDDDDLRRGQPTLHKAFDEATAVLVGDALIALAFHLIPQSGGSPENRLAVVADFGRGVSVGGLVNGQFADIQTEGQPYTEATLEYIHRNKTAALFAFACRAGARLAGAPEAVIQGYDQFGQALGLAFQMVDDLLDVQSSAQAVGKATGKDAARHKATYPGLIGVDATQARLSQLAAQAEAQLRALNAPDSLFGLTRFVVDRDR